MKRLEDIVSGNGPAGFKRKQTGSPLLAEAAFVGASHIVSAAWKKGGVGLPEALLNYLAWSFALESKATTPK